MNKMDFLAVGEHELFGYEEKIIDFTIENQLLDSQTWKIFVNQFRIHSDVDLDWRGEFWGKMMRGGCLTYHATKNKKLYDVLTESVKDLLSVNDVDGRISSYPIELEFQRWDMWVRKYVMLGLLYYLDICTSQELKAQVIAVLESSADYIINHVGDGKIDIFDTSSNYGGLNSCSILEPFVKLYKVTGESRYLDFSTYIVEKGFCKDMNLISCCLENIAPYKFKHTKAYEMISCFEGLLEYYKLNRNESYLQAIRNFVDMVVQTDFTIIGCSGCTSEFFDNSTERQTEYSEDIMQETCVTVTFMKLCAKLLLLTGESKYADYLERSAYNALYGAVNNEKQTMSNSKGCVWTEEGVYYEPHESFPFDSYSPLVNGKRGRQVGGFKVLQNGRSYGCCACIASAGTALVNLAGVTSSTDGFAVNLYNNGRVRTSTADGKPVAIDVFANLYDSGKVTIKVSAQNAGFKLMLRIPDWANGYEILLNGDSISSKHQNGYMVIDKTWTDDQIELSFFMPTIAMVKNGKVAFTRGPIVLCRDERFDDINTPLCIDVHDGDQICANVVANDKFSSNVTLQIPLSDGTFVTVCDYSQAGKNYDDDKCSVTVWQSLAQH